MKKKDEYINKVKALFLSYFKTNGYKKNNTFVSKNVFFLNTNDKKNSSSSLNNINPLGLSNNMNIIYKIINKTVSDNKESNNKESDNKEISVNSFIDNLVDYIFLLNEKIEEIELNMLKNNVYKNLKIIPNIISNLNNENEININKESSLKISILRLDNIKQGKYKITLHFTFSKKVKKHYSIKDIIIKSNQENQIVKVNYIFPIIGFDKNFDEEEKEFKNGTNLFSFYIKMIDIVKDETIFKSKKQYFHEIFRSFNFINNINEGMENIYYKLDFKFGCNGELKIYFFFDFNLNIQTKINILNNYLEYYNENIKTKNEKENEINFILDNHFHEISENVKTNLIEYNKSEINYNNNTCNCF